MSPASHGHSDAPPSFSESPEESGDVAYRVPRRRATRRGPARAADENPRHTKLLLTILASVILIVIVAFILSWIFSNDDSSVPDNGPTVHAATWPLQLPQSAGSYTRDPNTATKPTTKDGTTTLSATYAKDNQDAVIVLMSRPTTDLKKFMNDAAMNSVTIQPVTGTSIRAMCGTSLDNNNTSCAVLKDDTAVLAVGLLDQSRPELAGVANSVAEQAAQ